jgi:hypothetical protein
VKHTPGPWQVEALGAANTLIWKQDHGEIADTFYDPGNPKLTRAEAEANAHLIAAAPELLEALESAQQEFLGLSSYLATCEPMTILQNLDAVVASLKSKQAKAEAAIRKAKGEA